MGINYLAPAPLGAPSPAMGAPLPPPAAMGPPPGAAPPMPPVVPPFQRPLGTPLPPNGIPGASGPGAPPYPQPMTPANMKYTNETQADGTVLLRVMNPNGTPGPVVHIIKPPAMKQSK